MAEEKAKELEDVEKQEINLIVTTNEEEKIDAKVSNQFTRVKLTNQDFFFFCI